MHIISSKSYMNCTHVCYPWPEFCSDLPWFKIPLSKQSWFDLPDSPGMSFPEPCFNDPSSPELICPELPFPSSVASPLFLTSCWELSRPDLSNPSNLGFTCLECLPWAIRIRSTRPEVSWTIDLTRAPLARWCVSSNSCRWKDSVYRERHWC